MNIENSLHINDDTVLEPDTYIDIAMFEGVESLISEYGPVYKFNFSLFFTEKLVSCFCHDVPLYESRKLYRWASILSGADLDVDQEIDLDIFYGRYVKILIRKCFKNNLEYEKVEDLIELVVDPYEGKKPEGMSDQAWSYTKKYVEEVQKSLYG